MIDVGITLIGVATGAVLTALTTNWLQTKQRQADRELQQDRFAAERLERDRVDAQVAMRDNLAPVFSMLDELDRYAVYKLGDASYDTDNLGEVPEELRSSMSDDELKQILRDSKEKAVGSWEMESIVSLAIRSQLVAFRLPDPALATDFIYVSRRLLHRDESVESGVSALILLRKRVLACAVGFGSEESA